jgi:hypothetical protein
MSKSDAFEEEILDLVFLNDSIPLIGDAAGLLPSAATGSLYLSLHTGNPGEAGDQATEETTYPGYARVAAARTSAVWNRTNSTVSNVALLSFAASTGLTGTGVPAQVVTHFGIGAEQTGAGLLLYYTGLSTSLPIVSGVTPQFLSGNITITEL